MVSELRDPGTAVTATTVQATYRQLADTAVAALNCPARRTAESIALSATVAYRTVFDTVVTIPVGTVSDYAANGGSTAVSGSSSSSLSSRPGTTRRSDGRPAILFPFARTGGPAGFGQDLN